MIRIRHAGEEQALERSRFEHVGELLEWCARSVEPRVMTGLRVNGCDIPEQGFATLERFPLDGIELVEIESREARGVALASLESAAEYAPSVEASLRSAAAHFRAGRIEDANRLTAETTDAVGVLLYVMSSASRLLAPDRLLGPEAGTLAEVEAELRPWLEALVDAQEGRDWLRVADYLEYEVAERVAGWPDAIGAVKREAGGSEHG